jgi:type I restriction enzyme, S subunit
MMIAKVREGYKQTEVGVIPEDWEVEKLGDGIKLLSGHHVIARYCNTEGIGIPYLTGPADFQQGNIQHTKFTENPSTLCRRDDILVTVKGSGAGKMVLADSEYCISRQLMAVRVIDWDVLFLFSLLKQDESLFGAAAIGLIPGLSRLDILNKFIPLPQTIAEQTAIATALSDTDALITSLEKLIEKKRAIKQGAMQELLKPKEGWVVKRLGEVGETIIGLTYRPDNVKESGKLVLRSSNIQGNTLCYDDNVYVDVDIQEKLIVQENDLLICVRNGSRNLIGKCTLIKGRAIGETFGAFMSVFRSVSNEYIFNLFQSYIIKKQIDEYLGATINQITNKSLNSFEIPFPPLNEQLYISRVLNEMDAEITILEQKLSKYKLLKQGMMQELLTGKTRLI